ncbi:MAG: hypothetical protein KHY46_05435 [Clostridiales bacterium]|nr:hypothetical protein [Clostridiales bacterium]
MRERINRLARGMIENGMPSLVIKPDGIEGTVAPGDVIRGEITVNSGNGLYIKGLVYSSNRRVHVKNEAFGGLRNRIIYEADSSYLEHGDEIKGSFYLVTNGGEREIPYSLRIQTGEGAEDLGALKTPRDFANLAKRDTGLALRMFEYQDFTEAPFMQDPRVRTIYEGLKGRAGRRNLLEEFLVALRVKEPVTLTVDTSPRMYAGVTAVTEDSIDIASGGWGYAFAEISSDAPFIRLEARRITDQDFSDNRYHVRFQILPECLHRGRNFGRITIRSLRQSFTIQVEAEGMGEMHRRPEAGPRMDKESLYQYMCLRLDYEAGTYEPALLLNQMMKETERLRLSYPQDERTRLLQAELLILNGRGENAALVLEEAKDMILPLREEERELYCYYQYLKALLSKDESQKEGLARYIRKLLWENGEQAPYLFLLLMKLDSSLYQNPLSLYHSLENLYKNGSSSPFLYGAACRLAAAQPDLLDRLGDFEIQVLGLGIKKGLVTRELALKAARLLMGVKHYRRLVERLAASLYEVYPEMELLEAICSLLIRGEQKTREAFGWYEKAMSCHVNLTRLYEYFLYSLPEDYGHLLPKEVLLYFSYDKGLDSQSRAVLYKNILLYMNPASDLYHTYTRNMEQFAMEQLFQSRINSSLAVIYEHMIYKDMIDPRVAAVLPGILKSSRVTCMDPGMKYVILRYEDLQDEEVYLLENGEAYVPVFSKDMVFIFQDAYGNRYLDVKHRRIPVMDKTELLKQCYEVYPDHPMLKLADCRRILERGIHDKEEAQVLWEAMDQLRLNPVFKKRILKAVTEYYCREAGTFNCTCLIQMDKKALDPAQRCRICETLIDEDYINEAAAMRREYGCEAVDPDRLLKLCTRMILQQYFDQDTELLSLAYEVFCAGKADGVVLDYLCEHFNGTVSQMYELLIQGEKEHVETYDLEERLLCQMLFAGCCQQIDPVFQLYMKRKDTRESVIKAYFTQKSILYFLEGEEADGRVFSYLKKAVGQEAEKEKLPVIYLLALTKYFAAQESLSEEDKKLCRSAAGILMDQGLVFPYTRDLSKHIPIPEDIMDKSMIEYRGSREEAPDLRLRILPYGQEFTGEEMRRVFQGIYVKEKVLFEGETMEYRIYDQIEGRRALAAEGKLQCDCKLEGRENSRFACLNRMSESLSAGDGEQLLEAMEDYLKRSAALGSLFLIE